MTHFWKTRALAEMSRAEWESLCDGCAKCCLLKLEDDETGDIQHTSIACRLLDTGTCRCSNYAERRRFVPDCTVLTPANVHEIPWLPKTCAYRLVAEGRDLPDWHHLVCGDRNAVHRAGQSAAGWSVSERNAGPFEHHLVDRPDL